MTPLTPSWLMTLLTDDAHHLDAMALLLSSGQGRVMDASETVGGKTLIECLADKSQSWFLEGLSREHRAQEASMKNCPPRSAEVVLQHLLEAGADPWKTWEWVASGQSHPERTDGFDLAFALGSAPLLEKCLNHPSAPPLEKLYKRSPWVLRPHAQAGSLGKRLSKSEGLVSVALACGEVNVATVLLEAGWPLAPPRATHPLVCCRTQEALLAFEPWLTGKVLPGNVADSWRAWAVEDHLSSRSLAFRLGWLADQAGQEQVVKKTVALRAVELWSKGQAVELKELLNSLRGPGFGAATTYELTDEGKRWLSLAPLEIRSAGFQSAGELPVWLTVAQKTMNAGLSNPMMTQGARLLASISLENPPPVVLEGECLTVRGAGLLSCARVIKLKKRAPSSSMEKMGWVGNEGKKSALMEAAKACVFWNALASDAAKIDAAGNFNFLLNQYLKEERSVVIAWDDPLWSILKYVVEKVPGINLEEFHEKWKEAVGKASVEWTLGWVPIQLQMNQTTDWMDAVKSKVDEPGLWSKEALEKAEFVCDLGTPGGEGAWPELRSHILQRQLEQRWEGPVAERKSRVRM